MNTTKRIRMSTKAKTPRAAVRIAALATLALLHSAMPAAAVEWGDDVFRQSPEWYASAEARAAADSVIQYQSPSGGWLKNTDLLEPPASPDDLGRPTIDNGATTTPMRFLALVADATGEAKYQEAFTRGFDYLLAAQYPNGGWPQYFPLREGYYSRISYNDNAMINVLTLLRDVSDGVEPYGFVDQARRAKALAARKKGVEVILRSQIRQNGELTAGVRSTTSARSNPHGRVHMNRRHSLAARASTLRDT